MTYIDQLKQIADSLDRRGLLKQADIVDKILYKIAQSPGDMQPMQKQEEVELEVPKSTVSDPESKEQLEKLARTTYLMLNELRDFFARNLPSFGYFGDDNIKTLQSAIDHLTGMYRVLLRNISQQYSKDALKNYESHLKSLQKEVDRSKTMKLTPVKVKVDKFLLYNEFELLYKKIERHYDKGLRELQPVLRKARSIKDAFANIIQQTSEEVAHADLIETS